MKLRYFELNNKNKILATLISLCEEVFFNFINEKLAIYSFFSMFIDFAKENYPVIKNIDIEKLKKNIKKYRHFQNLKNNRQAYFNYEKNTISGMQNDSFNDFLKVLEIIEVISVDIFKEKTTEITSFFEKYEF